MSILRIGKSTATLFALLLSLLTAPQSVVAQIAISVTKGGTGSGTVVSDPAGINCGSICTATISNFTFGYGVTLTATASAGSVFAGWEGDCFNAATNTCGRVTSSSVKANFNLASAPNSANYSDIWWNPNESGWGLTLADHETQMFGVWYTYRQDGSPTWYVIPGGTFSSTRRLFAGDLYQTTGPAYNVPFNPSVVRATKIGNVSLDFAPPGLTSGVALFTYTIGAVTQAKQVQRQPFGDAAPNWGTDFTDIWWDPNQSGWGLTLAQHGNNVFAVWYTYDTAGQPLFIVMPGAKFSGPNSFTGDLYTTTGPYLATSPFNPSLVHATKVGTATIAFAPVPSTMSDPGTAAKAFFPRNATFNSTVLGYAQTKSFTAQSFGYAAPSVPTESAVFQLFVTTDGSGTGNVSSQPPGINCGGVTIENCAASFPKSQLVRLTATPGLDGSAFATLSGACSSALPTCTIVMSATSSVTATFIKGSQPTTPLTFAIKNPLMDGVSGQPYSDSVVAAGPDGGAGPYHFQSDTFANGTLPPGLGITLDGHLQGTPSITITASHTYTFGVCVVDTVGATLCKQTSITINAPSSLTCSAATCVTSSNPSIPCECYGLAYTNTVFPNNTCAQAIRLGGPCSARTADLCAAGLACVVDPISFLGTCVPPPTNCHSN